MTDVEPVVAFLRAAHEEIEKTEHGKRTLVARPTCPSCGNNASEFSFDSSDSYDLRCGDTVTVASFWEHNGEATPDRSALARVRAEKAVVELYLRAELQFAEALRGNYHEADQRRIALRKACQALAWGHRFIVDGFDPEWTPEGAET